MDDTEFMLHAFKGNRSAVSYVLMVAFVADVWDNLIDQDLPVTDESINKAFWTLAIDIPMNEFYQNYASVLVPVMSTGIMNWLLATKMEKDTTDPRSREIAHVIRYSIADITLLAASICGGLEWAQEVGVELRMRSQRSNMCEYVNSLRAS